MSYGCSTSPAPKGSPRPSNRPAALRFLLAACCLIFLFLFSALTPVLAAGQEEGGVIRLRSDRADDPVDESVGAASDGMRRGFDYETFEARLESLWFQRQALLRDGRDKDAAKQAERIRAFCTEEGVKRVEHLSAALVAESSRLAADGRYDAALASLDLAAAFDRGRGQVRFARAHVMWQAGRGWLPSASEFAAGMRVSLARSVRELSLFSRLGLVLVVAVAGALFVFACLMTLRYQAAFRHEIEEALNPYISEPWARTSGWGALLLPLILWIPAGWIAIYWVVALFRFMQRSERIAAVALLVGAMLASPAYRVGVTLYGMTVDPLARATIAAAEGEYDPDRVIKLRRLVDANPEDVRYRFLLAGLYRTGRYFEDSFEEYKRVLDLEPYMVQSHINVANIFFITGQHSEAIANYRRALEIDPDSTLAWFNMHLAQSESFAFKEAEASLSEARIRDSALVASMMSDVGGGNRSAVHHATLETASVWEAALSGRPPTEVGGGDATQAAAAAPSLLATSMNPVAIVSLLALVTCVVLVVRRGRYDPARGCIKCGRAFCHYCKSGGDGREYCRQCYHLFVLGDGLAAKARSRKEYEIEKHERRQRRMRSLASLVLPGAGQLLRGQSVRGVALVVVWIVALLVWKPTALLPMELGLGLGLRLDLLSSGTVPAAYGFQSAGLLALVLALVTWIAANTWRWRGREA